MSKIVAFGDIHGRDCWKDIVEQNSDADKFISLGDYFDSFEINSETQQRNFKELCLFKEKNMDKMILLLGNHDVSYIIEDICSGFQYGAAPSIKHLLSTYKDLLQMAYCEDNILFTHAGVGETWLHNNIFEIDIPIIAKDLEEAINLQWLYRPNCFRFTGWRDDSGDELGQTPIWIRPSSLLRDTKSLRKDGIIQVVGHTEIKSIDVADSIKKNLWLIDTLGTSGEYLVIENNEFAIKRTLK